MNVNEKKLENGRNDLELMCIVVYIFMHLDYIYASYVRYTINNDIVLRETKVEWLVLQY